MRMVLDGAHNPAAASALAALLDTVGARPETVLGIGRDKDVDGILASLAPRLGGVHVTRARNSPRALAPGELAARAAAHGLEVAGVHADAAAAVRAAAAALRVAGRSDDVRADVLTEPTVLVAGSLYLIGEVRPWLLGRSAPAWERWQ
jgi:dihydrofolate synthase/folylpolyglutamate synthase